MNRHTGPEKQTALCFASDQRSKLAQTSYGYDAYGRQGSISDARNGATTYGYNNADQVSQVTTPSPGTIGTAPQTTRTFYNKMLQATNVVYPDGTGLTNEFLSTGQLRRTYGSRTYPIAYGYDAQGRMTSMTNWSSFSPSTQSGARVTSWNYDPSRGWLTSKDYPDPSTGNPPATPGTTGPTYAYTPGGRLATRTWKRGVLATYTYGFNSGQPNSAHGDLVSSAYSNDPANTPTVTISYDRLGRQVTAVRNSMTTSFTYNDANQPLIESYSGGPLAGLSITNGYDQFMRRTNLTALSSSVPLFQHASSYDAASRLQTARDGENSATYSYLANSPLVGQIIFQQGSTTRMTTAKQYDFLNRLTSISSSSSAGLSSSFAYDYNAANQRTRRTEGDGSYWRYSYDSLGQVTSGKKYWSDQSPVAGQQFGYGFEDIGNRTQTHAGGDQNGGYLRAANYTANSLNQYASRDVPGAIDIMGLAYATNAVTVNGQTAYRKGEYFRDQYSLDNTSAAVWTNMTITEANCSPVSGHIFVPKNQEQFTYDTDGNLAQDGHWNYAWDGENRLVGLTNRASAAPAQVLRFEYDTRSRRIHKQVWNNSDGSGTPDTDTRFAYDGWNLIAILNSPSSIIESFLWGLDLSGSPQGAGAVGGLLVVSDQSTINNAPSTHFAAFDGNGNVAALVNSSDGTPSAQYEYGPFGEVMRATGPMANANPFRSSTKYHDDESDLVYYGYRYHNPSTGRWISRDPLFELGFELQWPAVDSADSQERASTYTFVRNESVDFVDATGLLSISDILGLAFNPPCGSISIQGKVTLSNWHVTGIGLVNKVPCNGIRLFLKGKINDALKQLPYSKTWACKNGNCTTVASIGPLNFAFSPSLPLVFNVDLGGDVAPPAKPKCRVDLELSGKITASGTIGYCCGDK